MSEKASLLGIIYEMRNDPAMRAVSQFIDIRIGELRVENDSLDLEEIKKNQGAIRELKQFQNYIKKGLPSFKKEA